MASISTDTLLQVYRGEAHRHDEWATKRFWGRLLNRHIFNGPDWNVSSEMPPDEVSQRRVDLVVERLSVGPSQPESAAVLMLVELKKQGAWPQDIQKVEVEVYEACMRHLLRREKQKVWAMTCYGTYARLWDCQVNETMLEPIYPINYDYGDRDKYCDFFQHQDEFLRAFEVIKGTPTTLDD